MRIPGKIRIILSFFILTIIVACNDDGNSGETQYFPIGSVKNIQFDQNNVAWMATRYGIMSYDGGTWMMHRNNLYFTYINDILLERGEKTKLWIATDKGFTLWDISDRNNIEKIGSVNATDSILPSTNVNTIFNDASSNKWIGTSLGIVILKPGYDENHLDTITNYFLLYEELEAEYSATSIDESNIEDYHFVGTGGFGIARIKYADTASDMLTLWDWPASIDLPSLFISQVLYNSSTGDQYFATQSGLAHHFGSDSAKNWTIYTTADSLPSNDVNGLAIDDENVWIATDGGVGRLTAGLIYPYTESDGLVDNQVLCVAVDNEQKIWFGTRNGISMFQDSTFESISKYAPTY